MYVLALDQGTTSSRAIVFDKRGRIVSKAQNEFEQIYPKSGWVEHDPMDILYSQMHSISTVINSGDFDVKKIAGIGITNQRETTIIWDKETGKPIYNAIVWQCRRTAELCEQLKEEGLGDYIREHTGLLIDAYFSGTKIKWILDNVEGARERAENGELLFGTVETWLIWNLTGGKVHVTDYSNASRTMLFDVDKLQWDEFLCEKLGVPMCMLPEPVESSKVYGTVAPGIIGIEELEGVPICGAIGDQPAALFGQACFNPGQAKNTYGTGCFLLMNIGEKPTISKSGLLTTVAWTLNGTTTYALEGSVFIGGAAIQWLRDEMKLISKASDSEISAQKVDDSNGVYVVPAFVGLGTPYWDDQVRGAVFGLTRATNKYHFVRATLEAIAYQSKDLMETIKKDSNIEINQLNVDGGATANNYLMQFQSDIIELPIELPSCLETTALGAAFFAGLYTGFYKSQEEIKKSRNIEREFKPSMSHKEVEERYKKWKIAVEATRVFR